MNEKNQKFQVAYAMCGELVAYTISLLTLLEFCLATSIIAKGLSAHLDQLFNSKLSQLNFELFERSNNIEANNLLNITLNNNQFQYHIFDNYVDIGSILMLFLALLISLAGVRVRLK